MCSPTWCRTRTETVEKVQCRPSRGPPAEEDPNGASPVSEKPVEEHDTGFDTSVKIRYK